MQKGGAFVLTEDGLVGVIPFLDLGAKARDPGIVGTELTVRVEQMMEHHGPIVFSHSSIQKLELAKKYNAGDVAEAKIVNFTPNSMGFELDGVAFVMRKVDISNYRKPWELTDIFAMGEKIKVYCMEANEEFGHIKWSIRALEPVPGALVFIKDKVFEEAEETAKIFYEKQMAAKQKMEPLLENSLGPSSLLLSDDMTYDDDDDDDDEGLWAERKKDFANAMRPSWPL